MSSDPGMVEPAANAAITIHYLPNREKLRKKRMDFSGSGVFKKN
jgi:hypothetical protein